MRMFRAFLLLALMIILVLLGARLWMGKMLSSGPSELPVHNVIGPFELVDQEGRVISSQSLMGKVWIADFIFTRCAGPCPEMTRNMKTLQQELPAEELRLVSFSMDPEYDTPERLAAYAGKFGADPGNWHFLTGPKEIVHGLSVQHFLLGVTEAGPGEGKMAHEMIGHSTKFVLVDRQGQIRGYYDGTDPDSLKRLIKHAKWIL